MNSPRRFLVFLLALLSAGTRLDAQQQDLERDPDVEAPFRQAVSRYSAGQYAEALRLFDGVLSKFPKSHRATAALIMKAKSCVRLNENLTAARTARTFLSSYPASSYVPDAHIVLGNVYDRIGRYDESLREYFSAWEIMPDPPAAKLFRQLIGGLDSLTGRYRVSMSFLEQTRMPVERAYIWLRIGEQYAAADNVTGALISADTLDQLYPGHPFHDRAAALRAVASLRSNVKLGVILPLMGEEEPSVVKELGNDVHDGILYAVEQFAADPKTRVKVRLESKDSGRNVQKGEQAARNLAEDREVIGIIGPVFSDVALAAAAPAQELGVPMVTPTANADGIAATGSRIFQANPDYHTRGRAMARFAILSRGLTSLAVLAPADTYGKFLAEGFIREATALGAKIVATEWYQKGMSDLKPQLRAIRGAGMLLAADPMLPFGGRMRHADVIKLVERGVPLRRIDSLMAAGATVPARNLLGPDARAILDSLQIPFDFDKTRLDSLEYPVNAVQAIYLPISSPEEMGVVASQIVYFNFETQMLGSGEWNSIADLDHSKDYTRGVIFESESFVDSATASYRAFAEGFLTRFKRRPTKNVLFGYDTANMVLSCIHSGAVTRDGLTSALATLEEYRGLKGRIGFVPRRVNSWLTILQYSGDAIQRVEDIRVE
jgi:ABC-type branched-subunit amino acid transport system substrate-binding protein